MSGIKEQEYSKQYDWNIIKRLVEFIKPYRKNVLILALFMFSLAGIDVLFPLFSKYAIDNFIVPNNTDGLKWFAIAYFVAIIVQSVNILFFISIAGKIEMWLTYDVRKKAFDKLQRLAFNYYDKTPVGWMMARMTSDSERLGSIISWGLVDMIWGFTMMIAIAVVMLILNWQLALITLIVVPALVVVTFFFQKKILKAYRQVRKTNSMITGAFNEGISGAKTTKTLVREKENLNEFQRITGKMHRYSIRSAMFSALYLPVVLSLGSIGTGLALWKGGELVIQNFITYGTLVAFVSYSVQFFDPLMELARIFAELQNAQASAERIFSMLDQKPQIIDRPEVLANFRNHRDVHIKGDLSFCNVTFRYDNGETVLRDFSLDIKAGETIALVGETGSGKSTIVNLACRFYEPSKGIIKLDGKDYRNYPLECIHANLGYVLQTPHLFSGTIKGNIRYGKLDASDEEIFRASELVNAHEFISSLPKRYETEVGEGGSLLSTGEKQLISFARAMLADPRIFVLDEATSSVDTQTEQMIQNAIHAVLHNRTSFIIAHRLSTIKEADRILVLKKGEVIEEGTHHDLIGLRGYYYRLYTNQFVEEQENKIMNA